MVRKRKPGAGRKPKLGTAMRSQLTVRMPDDARAQLEAAAKRRHRTLTDELLWRVRNSFAREYEQERDPAARALAFLFSMLAETIHVGFSPEWKWHKNPFMFKAFKLAVAMLLDALEPSGEMRTPYEALRKNPKAEQWLIEQYKTPESAARSAINSTLHRLFVRDHLERALAHGMNPEDPGYRELLDQVEREEYQMAHVRRDLGIEETSKQGR